MKSLRDGLWIVVVIAILIVSVAVLGIVLLRSEGRVVEQKVTTSITESQLSKSTTKNSDVHSDHAVDYYLNACHKHFGDLSAEEIDLMRSLNYQFSMYTISVQRLLIQSAEKELSGDESGRVALIEEAMKQNRGMSQALSATVASSSYATEMLQDYRAWADADRKVLEIEQNAQLRTEMNGIEQVLHLSLETLRFSERITKRYYTPYNNDSL